jgi:hypothetical protein
VSSSSVRIARERDRARGYSPDAGPGADHSAPQSLVGTNAAGAHLPLAIAVMIAILGFLPIANWVRGSARAPWYGLMAGGWMSGSVIVVGAGIVAAVLSRRLPVLWWEGAWQRTAERLERRPLVGIGLAAAIALVLDLISAWTVFDRRPLLIDEIVQLIQAQIFAAGALSRPVDPYPAFFSVLHIVDTNGHFFSQFPPGGPLFLVPGVLAGVPWLMGPVCGALAVVAFAVYVRAIERRAPVAAAATFLLACAPFMVFMSGTSMNHTPTLLCILVALACMAHAFASPAPRPVLAAFSGLAFGLAATIRPVDAIAFALPAGVWYLARTLRDRGRWREMAAAGAGIAGPIALLLWFNARTTGHPLLFGYELLWGPTVGLGFHTAPWGPQHTALRGLQLVNLYFLRLQTYLFETPFPALVPAIGTLALTRRLDAHDRYLAASAALLVGLYFGYWHNGFYIGPRFVFLLLPALVLWTARFPGAVRERFGNGFALRATVLALLCGALIAGGVLVPARAEQYRSGMLTMRWDADSAAEASGVRDGLVFVRESWGAQVIASLWELGVPRSESQWLYRSTDLCALDEESRALAARGVRGRALLDSLVPLTAQAASLVAMPFTRDSTARYLPGKTYTAHCRARLEDDRAGFTLLAPLVPRSAASGGRTLYLRDLHARDTLLLERYPGRRVYLLRPPSPREGDMPRFYPASRDSIWRAARAERP